MQTKLIKWPCVCEVYGQRGNHKMRWLAVTNLKPDLHNTQPGKGQLSTVSFTTFVFVANATN